ncbi:hypothetical protein M0208_05595 [Sphingomonas sp. SUN019]|uniref:hypothetical protein n=1 Tax=Sphingomonas sp. SUN019 TaxID=2937788 RepID=UPI002164AF8D|nr:hypothetical protein [Sphingomonas sp. SUN019]UVO50017.1 hypothetical protein M0208_05595 [Sphingomonas sp. SUN019]
MSINIGVRAGDIAIGTSLMARGERTQQVVDDASRTLSDTLHNTCSDDARRLDRPGALETLLMQPGPLDRLAARE